MSHEHVDPGFYGGPHWSFFDQFITSGLATLFWLAVIAALAWGALRLVRRRNAAHQVAFADEPSALELVRRRYALGEIDVATFEAMTVQLLASEERERAVIPQGRTYDQPFV